MEPVVIPVSRRWLLSLLSTGLLAAGGVSPAGRELARRYDALDVEKRWLAGRRVDWFTGLPRGSRPGSTHCSAFVASACARQGIEILRPPDHPQKGLANAQSDWLADQGAAAGWIPVPIPSEAQRLANEGYVVVVVFRNPDPMRPGHIALIRPCDKPDDLIRIEGPQLVQAGGTNSASISLARGFRNHREAWRDADHFRVRFYAHPPPEDLARFGSHE